MTIIDRYLVREAAAAAAAVFVVLFAVLFANRLIDYLADAAGGKLPGEAIVVLIGLQVLRYLGVILPAALFLGMVLALGRLYRDSEMPVLSACGVGPIRITQGLLLFAAPIAVLVGLLTLGVAPWASDTADRYAAEAAQRADLGALRAGRFIGGGSAGTVYASRVDDDGEFEGVFALARDGEREVVVQAQRGRQLYDPQSGQRYFVFIDGYRYDGEPGRRDWTVTHFARHGLLIDTREPREVGRSREGTPSAALWAAGGVRDLAEVHWRVAMPVMVVVLTLLAVPLAKAEPRDGRYGKLLTAVLVFVAYFQLLSTGRDWLEQGAIPSAVGLWWVHGVGLGAAMLWVRWRFGRVGWREGRLQRRPEAGR